MFFIRLRRFPAISSGLDVWFFKSWMCLYWILLETFPVFVIIQFFSFILEILWIVLIYFLTLCHPRIPGISSLLCASTQCAGVWGWFCCPCLWWVLVCNLLSFYCLCWVLIPGYAGLMRWLGNCLSLLCLLEEFLWDWCCFFHSCLIKLASETI